MLDKLVPLFSQRRATAATPTVLGCHQRPASQIINRFNCVPRCLISNTNGLGSRTDGPQLTDGFQQRQAPRRYLTCAGIERKRRDEVPQGRGRSKLCHARYTHVYNCRGSLAHLPKLCHRNPADSNIIRTWTGVTSTLLAYPYNNFP